MRKIFLVLLLTFMGAQLNAQTIIDLKKGGTVRAKTTDDYSEEMGMRERQSQDSVAYINHLRLAFNALYADSLDEAEKRFKAALKLFPEAAGNQVVYYNLALIKLARGKQSEAVEDLTSIIKDFPDYYDARIARAEARLQLNQAREAIQDAETLLAQPATKGVPEDVLWHARFIRAAARYQLHLYADAYADISILLKEQPENENARILEALALQKMGQNKEALNRLNLIVASNPKSIDALTTRASVLAELEMFALARADYDALIELEPNESDFYVERARMLVQIGEKSAARRDLDKAVSLGVPHGVVQALYNLTR